MRVAVSGGAGFLGSHIVDALIDAGHEVMSIDNLSGGFKRNFNSKAQVEVIDLCNKEAVEWAFTRFQPEVVYHCAANAREGASFFDPAKIVMANQVATINTLEAAIKVGSLKKWIQFSSMAVYGKQEPPFKEDLMPKPCDVYGIAKYSMEETVKVLADCHGFKYTIIRPHNCYDNQTEVLTSDGFKLFKDLNKTDLIATLNPETDELEYHLASAWQKIRHKGKLLHFNSKSFDLMVTPEHRMYIKRNKAKKYDFLEAEKLIKDKKVYCARLKTCVNNWVGTDRPVYIIPEMKDSLGRPMINNHQNSAEKVIPMELWCEFLGWYISEGCRFKTKMNYVISIVQYGKVNPENRKSIIDLIKKMGFNPYWCDDKEIRIFSKQLYKELDKLGVGIGSINKCVPKEFKQLNSHYLQCLFNSLMKGAGHISKDGKHNSYKTVSPKLADDFVEICLKLGKSTNVGSYDDGDPNHNKSYTINITDKNAPQIGDNYTKTVHAKEIDYDDFVYDVTVPNHIIFVRRNGKACWSSNCFGPRQNIRDKYRNVIGIFMNNIMRKESIYIYGDGQQKRQFSYIFDMLPSVIKCIELADNETINIGGTMDATVEVIAFEVINAMLGDMAYPIYYINERYGEVKHAYCDPGKSIKMLGYQEKIGIVNGIKDMFLWAQCLGPQDWAKEELSIPNHHIPKTWR